MKKDLIDTIMEKDYHALTASEREELKSFCNSEDEYNQMKEVFIGVEGMSWEHPKPKAETKQRLDELFDNTYPKAAPVWYSSVLTVVVPKDKPVHRQPLAQIAAIALLVLLTVPFWNSEVQINDKPVQMAQADVVDQEAAASSETAVPVKDKPVAEAENETAVNVRVAEDFPATPQPEPGGRVASASAAGSGAIAENRFNSLAEAAADEHPDGVFVAVSQPASEEPEMLDLLTATF